MKVVTIRDTTAEERKAIPAGTEGESLQSNEFEMQVAFQEFTGWVPSVDLAEVPKTKYWRLPLNIADVTVLKRQYAILERYWRQQDAVTFTASDIKEPFWRIDMAAGGAGRLLNYARYTMEVEGRVVAQAAGPFTSYQSILVGSWTDQPDELYLAELYGWDAAGTKVLLMRFGINLDREGLCKNSLYVWRHSGSFAWAKTNRNNDVIKMPKSAARPVPRPLPVRKTFQPVTTPLGASKIGRRMLVPGAFENDHDNHILCTTKSGILITENIQGYLPNQLFEKHSRFPILEGPRNVCRIPSPLLVKDRREGQTLFCGNGYIMQTDSTGAAKLLAGHCHKEAIYYNEPATSVLDPRYKRVGKWHPSILTENQIFNEPWGGGWVAKSLQIDPNASPIDNELPHLKYTTADGRFINGPLWLQTDFVGCIWSVMFDGSNLDAEPDIDYFLPPGTFLDAWGMVTHENVLFVGDRIAQKIVMYDLDKRTLIGDLVSSPTARMEGFIGAAPLRRFNFYPGHNAETARAFDICYPEGMDKFVDEAGDLWIYWASTAAQEVRRIRVRDRKLEKALARPTYGRSGVGDFFTTLAVSPLINGFGPPGTMFTSTFLNSGFGKAQAFLPAGVPLDTKVPPTLSTQGQGWGYFNYQFGASNYAVTQCVGRNHLTTCDVDGWTDQFHLLEPGLDPAVNWAQVSAGFGEWCAWGYSAEFGPNGVGAGSNLFPWGRSVNLDAYMTWLGLPR